MPPAGDIPVLRQKRYFIQDEVHGVLKAGIYGDK